MKVLKRSSMRRFFRRTKRVGECWVWTGPVNASGYGIASIGGVQGVQRIAWVYRYGAPPKGNLRNVCGNRLCANAGHWRDEGPKRLGRVAARKLEIERHAAAGLGIGEIADRVGCSRTTVWRHLKGADLGVPGGDEDQGGGAGSGGEAPGSGSGGGDDVPRGAG